VDTTNKDNSQIITFPKSGNLAYFLPKSNLPYYCSYGIFESQLIDWCRQFCDPSKVFLDIGAHTGTYALSLVKHCLKVHAFEPQRCTYYALCGSVALSGYCDKIVAHNYGLGSTEQEGEHILNIVSNDGGGSSMHTISGHPVLHTETIQVRQLDKVLSEEDKQNIGFIKMDVEDNERFVLEGATDTLHKSGLPTVLFESNHENTELFSYIESLGYDVIPISGVKNMFLGTRKW
jgi:FkbM family methyltransferase